MENRFSGHGVYRTEYHIVWIPKYRRRILNPGFVGILEKIIPEGNEGFAGMDCFYNAFCVITEYEIIDLVIKINGNILTFQ